METQDTIAEIATPQGTGGISVVRVSGPNVGAVANQVIGRLPRPRQASLRPFAGSDGHQIDEGLAIYFPAPGSFTGEDVLELHGHGGPILVSEVLQSILKAGARPAAPGEFSERAFLNGRLDLAQAEGIADLINSATVTAARSAMRSLKGEFSEKINAFNVVLADLRAYIEAAIDFPEEEIDFLTEGAVEARVCSASQRLSQLQEGASQGALLASGIRVVLAGRPNVGKSSLLNRLSTEDRVIVSDIAGTTRDVVTVSTEIEGLKVELVDTAGLREAENALEVEGVKRARRAIEEADLTLLVVDDALEAEGANGGLENEWPPPADYILVRNKCDLSGRRVGVLDGRSPPAVCVSAKTGAGLDALKRCIASAAGYQVGTEPPVMARQRHIQAIIRAREHLVQAEIHAVHGQGELIAEALRLAQDCLGEITGAVTTEALLGDIFSSFCIGK
ncbi:MAG TPA: tRNA uridine-5-carboxymethylaminomethyl(34) synthesis GTPase MnmE [Gammaproteobacteria bacterium]|nr:tRNA uridine-5-carboxymethylaminomethyl(34) synthesis GTPase MnmE [Gammaproteobacteria bacterium]